MLASNRMVSVAGRMTKVEELNGNHQDVENLGHARGHELIPEEVADSLRPDTGGDEAHIGNKRVDQRHSDNGGGGNLEARHNARDVHEENAEEERGQQRQVSVRFVLAENFVANLLAHEIHEVFDGGLGTTGNELGSLGVQDEDENDDDDGDQTNQDEPVDFERGTYEKKWFGKELFQSGHMPEIVTCG